MTTFLAKNEPVSAGPQSSQKLPSVLFLLFDEFPTLSLLDEDGSIDRVRFPNLLPTKQSSNLCGIITLFYLTLRIFSYSHSYREGAI